MEATMANEPRKNATATAGPELAAAQEALRESEQHFQLLVEGVRDHAIYLLHPDGRVASWNVGAARISGYTTDEIVGGDLSRFYVSEDVQAGKPRRDLEAAAQTGRFQ